MLKTLVDPINDRERSKLVRINKHARLYSAQVDLHQDFCHTHQITNEIVLSSTSLRQRIPKKFLWLRPKNMSKLWIHISTSASWQNVNKCLRRINLSQIHNLRLSEPSTDNGNYRKISLIKRILKSILRLTIRSLISFSADVICYSFIKQVYLLLKRIKAIKHLSLNYAFDYCFVSQEIKQIAPFTGKCKAIQLSLPSHRKLENISEFVTEPNWSELQGLDLWGNNIGDVGAAVLARNVTWKTMRILNLSSNKLGAEGIGKLVANSTWSNLRALYLQNNILGVRGIRALAANSSWRLLEKLDLSLNLIGDEEVKALATNVTWKNLLKLKLDLNQIQDNGVKWLAANSSWPRLEKLNLSQNVITSGGVKSLAGNASWKNLKVLMLSHNRVGKSGAVLLAGNSSWEKLEVLCLQGNQITEEGLQSLKSNQAWKRTIKISV